MKDDFFEKILNNQESEDSEFDSLFDDIPAFLRRYDSTPLSKIPRFENLPELVEKAKGSRSMRKFAEETGVNVSTISRMINGKLSDVSDETLEKIAAEADPGSGITFERLQRSRRTTEFEKERYAGPRFEDTCKRAITEELLMNEFSVRYKNSPFILADFDFEIMTDAINEKGGRWLFTCKIAKQPSARSAIDTWLNEIMAYYYAGGEADRVSIVVNKATAFEMIKANLEALTVPDEISVILISERTEKVQEEYVAPLTDNRKPTFVFDGQ